MLKLEELKKHAAVSGIDPAAPVRIVSTEAIGNDALTVYYKTVKLLCAERRKMLWQLFLGRALRAGNESVTKLAVRQPVPHRLLPTSGLFSVLVGSSMSAVAHKVPIES